MTFDYNDLYIAWKDVSAGKRDVPNQAKYRFYLEDNLYDLQSRLRDGTFCPAPLRLKQIYYPKRRVAQIPGLEDKIVQHAVCDGYGYFALTKPCITECSANIRRRGEQYATALLTRQLRSFYARYGRRPLVLKCDIKSYYASIDHGRARELLDRYVTDPEARAVMVKFLGITEQGLPLGLQQSQLLANLYLCEMDHKLKERQGVEFYGRYMDDFYILADDRETLEELLEWIQKYVESIGLRLNPKTGIFDGSFDYLGWTWKVTATGKIVRRLRKDKVKTKRRHLRATARKLGAGEMTPDRAAQSYKGWRSHALQGDCRNMLLAMDRYYDTWLRAEGYRLYVIGKNEVYILPCQESSQK